VEDWGLVHVHTGEGEGRTTAALGPAQRAAGQELRIDIVQFMKGWQGYGEIKGVDRLPTVAVHPLELILAGRHTHLELIDRVGLVVEMGKVTPPFERSTDDLRGIEL
jgi:ATP:corrinoid adenosyltransferase